MRAFSYRLICHAFQCFINLIFLYDQDHAVCVLGLACGAVGTVVLTRDGVHFSFFISCPQISAGETAMYVLRSS